MLLAARRAAELAPSPERQQILVHLLNGYAGSLEELGDEPSLNKALSLMAKAQAILDTLNDEGELRAVICANYGRMVYERGLPEKAIKLVDRAISIDKKKSGLAHCTKSLILDNAGRHEEAIAEARLAMSMIEKNKLGVAHHTFATIFHHNGNIAEALDEIRAGLTAQFEHEPLSDSVQELLVTASLVLHQKDRNLALEASEAAQLVSDVRRLDVGGDPERIAYDDNVDRRQVSGLLVQQRLDAADYIGALSTADRHRAVLLPPAESELTGAGETNEYADVKVPPSDSSLADQIDFVSARARAFLAHRGIAPPLDASELQKIVTSHERVIVFMQPYRTELRIFVVRPGTPVAIDTVVARRPLPEITELADNLRTELGISVATRAARGDLPSQFIEGLGSNSGGESQEKVDAGLNRLRLKLHDSLFSEVLPRLHDQEPIALVPYRELAVIPFAVLTSSDGQTLAERHPVSVLPSISSLASLAKPSLSPPTAVILGNPQTSPDLHLEPLEGATAEANAIFKILTTAGIDTQPPLLGPDATEAKLRTSIAGARIVHLACHAALREPASSSPLFLASSPPDNGLLLPAEITDFNLDGALVVLSACQSGLGRTTADGVVGLGRAFMQAGARALLLSLWRVGDKVTHPLMCEFYRGLLGTADGLREPLDVAAAASRAQFITRDKVCGHPSAWGPWVVVGDGAWRIDQQRSLCNRYLNSPAFHEQVL